MQVNFNARGTQDADGGSTILDLVITDIVAAFKRIERFAGLPNGYAPLDGDGLIPAEFLGGIVTESTLMVTSTAAVNTVATATLPAISGQFHAITRIELVKLYNVVGVAAGAGVLVASTNLPGNPAWTTEQLASPAGTAMKVIDITFAIPLRSLLAGVATTFTAPAQLQTIWRWNITYAAVSA